MSIDDLKLAASIVIPILTAGIGAYIKIKIDIEVIKSDLNNIAFLIGTKRAKAERETKGG